MPARLLQTLNDLVTTFWAEGFIANLIVHIVSMASETDMK